MADSYSLSQLLHPISISAFKDEYFESRYLHVPGKSPSKFKDILEPQDVDNLLQSNQLQYPNAKLIKEGNLLSGDHFIKEGVQDSQSNGRIDNDSLFKFMGDGHTLIINGIDSYISKTERFNIALEKELLIRTQCNLYVTPAGKSKGLDIHYDTHDVFVLQIKGSKNWEIYHSDEIEDWPTKKTFEENSIQKTGKKKKYELKENIELNEGDLLYIPRGTPHAAVTTDETSIHIALGLLTKKWYHLFNILAGVAENHSDFRQSLPSILTNDMKKESFEQDFLEKFKGLFDSMDIHDLTNIAESNFKSKLRKSNEGRLLDLIHLDQLTLETSLRRRDGIMATCSTEGFSINICYSDKKIPFPLPMQESIEYIMTSNKFRVKDIKGAIKDALRIDISRKLIIEGFLTVDHN